MLASHTQSETLQCGTSSSKLPFQKRALSSILAFTGGCLEAEALGPVCPMAKFRKACVTGALKGRSVLLMKSRALVVSQMRTEENLAPYAAGVLQASERLREISFCTPSSTPPTPTGRWALSLPLRRWAKEKGEGRHLHPEHNNSSL